MTRFAKIAAAAALFALGLAAPAFAQGDSAGGGGTQTKVQATGEGIYNQTCAACHMKDGKGATGAATIPALAANPRLSVAAYPITIALRGKGVMPGFGEYLKPAELAQVLTYVRTHFGNSYDKPVTEADVAQIAATNPHR